MPPSQPWVDRALRERFPYLAVLRYLTRNRGVPVGRAERLAEDAVQLAFLQILTWDFENEDVFRILWHRYARLRAIDLLDRTPENRQAQMPEGMDVGAESADHFARGQDLAWALNQLSPEHRTVINLYYHQDLTLASIATLLNVSLSTVHNRVRAALGQLRHLLHAYETD
jgi:RNA polymerase sigma factor (sigma-70 family)